MVNFKEVLDEDFEECKDVEEEDDDLEDEDKMICELCGSDEDVQYVDLGEMTCICQSCLEMNYLQCDRCGDWNDPEFVEYHQLKNGQCVCDGCFNPDIDEEE